MEKNEGSWFGFFAKLGLVAIAGAIKSCLSPSRNRRVKLLDCTDLSMNNFLKYYIVGKRFYDKYYYFSCELEEIGRIETTQTGAIKFEQYLELMRIINKYSNLRYLAINADYASKRKKLIQTGRDNELRRYIRNALKNRCDLREDYKTAGLFLKGINKPTLAISEREYGQNINYIKMLIDVELGIDNNEVEMMFNESEIATIIDDINKELSQKDLVLNEIKTILCPYNKETLDYLVEYYKAIYRVCKLHNYKEDELEVCILHYCRATLLKQWEVIENIVNAARQVNGA